jgi:hypothetical protein
MKEGEKEVRKILVKSSLLKVADDWRDNIFPPESSVSITTGQLLTLAD